VEGGGPSHEGLLPIPLIAKLSLLALLGVVGVLELLELLDAFELLNPNGLLTTPNGLLTGLAVLPGNTASAKKFMTPAEGVCRLLDLSVL
jgi:hypothetical protein